MYTKQLKTLLLLTLMIPACGDQIVNERERWSFNEGPSAPSDTIDIEPEQPTEPAPIEPVLVDPPDRAQGYPQSIEGTCSLSDDGALVCWGGMASYSTIPHRFKTIDTWRGLCGVTLDDKARCYAATFDGLLMEQRSIHDSFADAHVLDIVRSGTSTCVTLKGGDPVCWRDGAETTTTQGLLEKSYQVTGTNRIQTLVAGTHRFCGLGIDKKAYCWGTSPNALDGSEGRVPNVHTSIVLDGGRQWQSIDIYNRFCGVDLNGVLRCYGNRKHPDIVMKAPVEGDRFEQVKLSVRNGCARTVKGYLYCWSERSGVELGRADRTIGQPIPSPTMQPVDTDARFIDFSGGGHTSNCGLTKDRRILCWGERGQHDNLGQQAAMYLDTPRQIAPTHSWMALSFNGQTACALNDDSLMFCWGKHLTKEVGQDHVIERTTPQYVQTPIRYKQLVLGATMACGRGDQATWTCWGAPDDLAWSTNTDEPFRPLALPEGLSLEMIALSKTSNRFGCGLAQDGHLWCWGELPYRAAYGDGSNPEDFLEIQERQRTLPTKIYPNITWSKITIMGSNVCGLTQQGQLMCWGDQFTRRGIAVPEDGGPLRLQPDMRFSTLHPLTQDVLCVDGDQLYCMKTPNRAPFHRQQLESHSFLKPVHTPFAHERVLAHAGELCIYGVSQSDACMPLKALNTDGPVSLIEGPKHITRAFEHLAKYNASTFMGITHKGELMTWGHNYHGLLGRGVETYKSTPVEATVYEPPTQ